MLVKPRLVLKRGDQPEPVTPPGARPQTRDRHHDAPDDGRRGAVGTGSRARLAGYSQRRQDGLRADLRLRDEALHAHLQRVVHGLRAADQSAGGGGGDAERHARRGRIRRQVGGAGVQEWSPAKRCACSTSRKICRRPRRRRWSRRMRRSERSGDRAIWSRRRRTFWKRAEEEGRSRSRSRCKVRRLRSAARLPRRTARPACPEFPRHDHARRARRSRRQGICRFFPTAAASPACNRRRRARRCIRENASAYSSHDESWRNTLGCSAAPAARAGTRPVQQLPRLEYDSRRVAPQSLFFAFPGSKADGRQFAADALARGARGGGQRIARAAKISTGGGFKWSTAARRCRWPRAISSAGPTNA